MNDCNTQKNNLVHFFNFRLASKDIHLTLPPIAFVFSGNIQATIEGSHLRALSFDCCTFKTHLVSIRVGLMPENRF